jgi:hypothetical protein
MSERPETRASVATRTTTHTRPSEAVVEKLPPSLDAFGRGKVIYSGQ